MKSFKPEVSTDGGKTFSTNALRFATREEAAGSAQALMMRWMLVTDWRVGESDDPVNYTRTDGRDEYIVPARND
jgi:hypothetical protein